MEKYKYTILDACKFYAVGESTIRRWIKNNKIDYSKEPAPRGGFQYKFKLPGYQREVGKIDTQSEQMTSQLNKEIESLKEHIAELKEDIAYYKKQIDKKDRYIQDLMSTNKFLNEKLASFFDTQSTSQMNSQKEQTSKEDDFKESCMPAPQNDNKAFQNESIDWSIEQVINEIKDKRKEGKTNREIANHLNKLGVKTPANSRNEVWTMNMIKKFKIK